VKAENIAPYQKAACNEAMKWLRKKCGSPPWLTGCGLCTVTLRAEAAAGVNIGCWLRKRSVEI